MQGHLFTLDLKLFCAPRARIKIFDIFEILHGKKFRSSNFRILELYTKYAKFCTIQKFPAIRYQSHCYHFLNVCTKKRETTLQLATRAAAILRAAHNPQQRYVPACLGVQPFHMYNMLPGAHVPLQSLLQSDVVASGNSPRSCSWASKRAWLRLAALMISSA